MAPTAGVIEELLVPDGEKVVAGQDLFKLKVGGSYLIVRSLFWVQYTLYCSCRSRKARS
jgi:hypothetical protein